MNGCETPCYGRDKAAEDTTRDTTTARINRAVKRSTSKREHNNDITTSLSALLPADHSDL